MRLTLTEARERRRLTPDALAVQAGVSRATVYRLESGDIVNPSSLTVERLETALRLKRGTLQFARRAA